MDLLNLSATLTLDSSQYEQGISQAEGKARGLANGGFTVLKGAMANLVSGGINLVAGALNNNLMSAFSRVDTMNNYGKVMGNLGHDSKQAEAEIKRLGKGIDGLPTALDQITSMQQQFASLGGSLSDATDITLALNNATLAGGRGQAVASSAMQQWYQIIAKGKPDAQSMYIINDAMPAQMKAISEKVLGAGKTFQDLNTEWQKNPEITEKVKDAILDLNKNGFGDMASFKEQAKSATEGIQTGMQNIQTAITKGMANFMMDSGLDKIIGEQLGNVKDAINGLFQGATDFVNGSIKAYTESGFTGVATFLYDAVTTAYGEGFTALKDVVWDAYVALMSVDWSKVFSIALKGIGEAFKGIFTIALDFNTLKTDIILRLQTVAGEAIKGFIDAIATHGDEIIKSGIDTVVNFVTGIYENASKVVSGASRMIANVANYIAENSDKIANGAVKMVGALISGLIKGIPKIVSAVWKWKGAILKGIIKIVPAVVKAGINLVVSLAKALINSAPKAMNAMKSLGSKMIKAIGNAIKGIASIGSDIVQGIWKGISNGYDWIKGKIKSWVGNVVKFLKNLFGIKSPSKVMAKEIGQWIPKGIAKGIEDNASVVSDALDDVVDIPDMADGIVNNGSLSGGFKMVTFAPTVTVDGAEQPEEYAMRLMRKMKMEARMA